MLSFFTFCDHLTCSLLVQGVWTRPMFVMVWQKGRETCIIARCLIILQCKHAGFQGAQGAGPQASHQQGASHQTLHIFVFVREMCVSDFRLVTPSELGPRPPTS